MASDDSSPEPVLMKSSSRDSRVVCETLSRSSSQQKPDVRNKGKKGYRSGNDLFVCFAPRASLNLAHRSILSPGRDKGRETSRRSRGRPCKSFSGPIFSLPRSEKAGRKQAYEGEEPTSPKVTCIGQVRARQKHGKTLESVMQDKDSVHHDKKRRSIVKAESASPGRSFSSPSRPLKWAPFFGSRKEPNPSACPSFGKDFSCFGLSCDSPTHMPHYREGKDCKAVFAKSLILIQETEERNQLKGAQAGKQVDAYDQITSQDGDEVGASSGERQQNTPEASLEGESNTEVQATLSDENVGETGVADTSPPPPPPHALLLMRRKLEPLNIFVPPTAGNCILKRSSSAPAQCRLKKVGNCDEKKAEAALLRSEKKSKHSKTDEKNSSPERLQQLESPKAMLKRCKSYSTGKSPGLAPESNTLSVASGKKHVSADEQQQHLDAVSEETANQVDDEKAAYEGHKAETSKEPRMDELDRERAFLRRQSVSEALKVSVDVVPETWLWKSCANVRSLREADQNSCQGRPENLQGPEWLDAEIEASLWRSCYVTRHFKEDDGGVCEERTEKDGQSLEPEWIDSRLEACLWRNCSIVDGEDVPHQEESERERNLEGSLWLDAEVHSPPWRSCTYHHPSECRELKAVCSDLGEQNEGLPMSEEEEGDKRNESEISDCSESILNCAQVDRQSGTTSIDDAGETKELISFETKGIMKSIVEEAALQKDVLVKNREEKPVDTLLFLTYKVEALRVSVDGSPENMFKEPIRKQELEEMGATVPPQFLDIGNYVRVLKAAGKDYTNPCTPVSLPSAFRLQRCKSEPVRLNI